MGMSRGWREGWACPVMSDVKSGHVPAREVREKWTCPPRGLSSGHLAHMSIAAARGRACSVVGAGKPGPGKPRPGNLGAGNLGPGNLGAGNLGPGNLGAGNLGAGNL